jgi:membrane-associated protease RseP (regulator of RpoE activity)
MSYALGVIFFVVALLVSVMLHELGHFATAKAYGMKATRFFVGFGPTLWSTHRGETEYGVKAIPAGGFVKIVGMTPLEEVEPGDEERAFYRQPARQRLVVLASGSVIHLLIAFVLLYLVLVTSGDPLRVNPTLTVDSTQKCVVLDSSRQTCKPGDPAAPARGVLESGDRIVAIDGTPTTTFDVLRHRLESSAGHRLTLTLVRDGSRMDVQLTPIAVQDHGQTIGRIGFYPAVERQSVGVLSGVPRTFTTLGEFAKSTGTALWHMPSEVSQILHGQPRGNGAASVVDIARVSGQIAQARVSLGDRLASLLLIVAQVNFFVGVFNLLPLLPLDGGHIAIIGFEQARRRVYSWFGRPDPGRVDLLKVMPVTYAVVAVFIGLSLLLLYAGIVNPIRLQ